MKKAISYIVFVFITTAICAQEGTDVIIDSLKKELLKHDNDSSRFHFNERMFLNYAWTNPDKALPYIQENIGIARKLKSDDWLSSAIGTYGYLLKLKGNFPQALEYSFEALKLAEKTKNLIQIGEAYHGLGEVYMDLGDYPRALAYINKGKSAYDENYVFSIQSFLPSDTADGYLLVVSKLALAYEKNNQLDSARKYIKITEQLRRLLNHGIMNWDHVPLVYGNINFKEGNYLMAISNYHQGVALADIKNYYKGVMDNAAGLANTYNALQKDDSAMYFARMVMEAAKYAKYPQIQLEALTLLAKLNKSQGNMDSAVLYFERALEVRDSLFNQNKMVQLQNQTYNEQIRQQAIIENEKKLLNRYRIYALASGLVILSIISLLLHRNSKNKQKANNLIEQAYYELKSTQAQLVQREKMASLGELAAGIAHEIQNPLNFVNNFSEINAELIVEMKSELRNGHNEEAITLGESIEENEKKINHHGKRADAIVKSMLQHSKASSGKKEPTNINTLADEYLRLSYQGLRAKDKSFNATLKTNFEPSIEKINIIPQDIGRVLLNLFNNAFYAVAEKKSNAPSNPPEDEGYEPVVTVSTKQINGKVEIKVADNGHGISEKIRDKIFQPFFTTKPTGQGTGLGLSLSYDIIKAHGGEVKVEAVEGEGSTFIILLPYST